MIGFGYQIAPLDLLPPVDYYFCLKSVGMERRFAAIPAADVAGSLRMMGEGPGGYARHLKQYRELIGGAIQIQRGRIFGIARDSLIADLPAPVEALRCAIKFKSASGSASTDYDAEAWNAIG
jgi:class 3 adenylate cyclase